MAVVDSPPKPRTSTVAWFIGLAALLLPFALFSYTYPQWIFLSTQGPFAAGGSELWYGLARSAGSAVAFAVAGFAVFGIVRGGAARIAGILTVCVAVALLVGCAFASYVLFHVASAPCGIVPR